MDNKKEIKSNVSQLTMRIGKTTYVIGMNFKEDAKENLDDKIRKIVSAEVKGVKSRN